MKYDVIILLVEQITTTFVFMGGLIMNSIEQLAIDILDVSKKIFWINKENNPQTIFKDNIFLISEEGIKVEHCNNKESSYYFENQELDGVIIRNEEGNYCIKATIQYTNSDGKKWGFAKIRIHDYQGEICIRGRRTGSWEMADFEDEDFIENPDFELPLVLNSMNNSLNEMYIKLEENIALGDNEYLNEKVKILKKYNI